jgi:hypothetical protein
VYDFIFAANQQEAIQFYKDTFFVKPLNCHEYPLDFQMDRGDAAISFREWRKEILNIPAIAVFMRGKVTDRLFFIVYVTMII